MKTTSGNEDKAWYNRFYGEQSGRNLRIPGEIIERYRTLSHANLFFLEKWHQLIGDVRGKRLLYIACGLETSGILLALKGGEVWVLDIAFEAIRQQRKMAIANDIAGRVRFVVASCDQLPFRSQSFDLATGIGFWHHLQDDLDTPCSEVARVLKEESAFAVFEEPITRNDFLKRLRSHVPVPPPRDVSPQCRPLPGQALHRFTRHFQLQEHPFRLLARLDRLVLRETPLEFASAWQRWTVFVLNAIDSLLLVIPGFDRFACVVVLKLTKCRAACNEGVNPTPIQT